MFCNAFMSYTKRLDLNWLLLALRKKRHKICYCFYIATSKFTTLSMLWFQFYSQIFAYARTHGLKEKEDLKVQDPMRETLLAIKTSCTFTLPETCSNLFVGQPGH